MRSLSVDKMISAWLPPNAHMLVGVSLALFSNVLFGVVYVYGK